MTGIQKELNQIKNAVYGRDVRQAIHDGIKKTYDDASVNGNAHMEIVMARGNHRVLNERLNNIDFELKNKREKSEEIKLSDLAQDVKESMTGGSVAVVGEGAVGNVNLKNRAVTPEKTSFFLEDKNIFKGLYEPYRLITTTGGGMRITSDTGGKTCSLAIIPIEPSTVYTVKSHDEELTDCFRIGLSNRPFQLSEFGIFNLDDYVVMGDFTVPDREYTFTTNETSQFVFILVSEEGNEPRLKLEEGSLATEYLDNPKIDPKYIDLKPEIYVSTDKNIIPLNSKDMYTVPSLEGVNSPTSTHKIHEQNSTSMYALYDSLLNQYPGYIKKDLLIYETSGKPIYTYTFMPEQPEISRTDKTSELPHFFVVSGVHGSEKAGWWCLYETMKQICENWKDSKVLETLRWNVKFTVIPIVNVYGVDNPSDPVTFNGKINANGVDINRNFPSGWIKGTEGTIGYGGSVPLSEPETTAIYDFLSNNKIDFYADFHNFSSQSDPNYFMWNIIEGDYGINLSQSFLTSLSVKWKKQDELFPQDDSVFFGYTSIGTGGSTPPLVKELGILGGIFEISHTMHPKGTTAQYSSEVITLGTEAQINWLYTSYENLCK